MRWVTLSLFHSTFLQYCNTHTPVTSIQRYNKGKIFCGDCGITMGYTVSGQDSMSYYCPNYKENGAIGCVKKRISAKKLEKALTAVIQTHLKMFMENKTAIQLKISFHSLLVPHQKVL